MEVKKKYLRRKAHSMDVIQLLFSLNDNRVCVISELTGHSKEIVSKIIDNYFKDGGVIVESKMNDPDFDL